MQASLIVKGRRLGMFLLQIKDEEVKISPLDEQGDMHAPELQSNLTADLRDAYSDEQTASSPNEIHAKIIKEILRLRGEDSLLAPASSSIDDIAKRAREAARLDNSPRAAQQNLERQNVATSFDPLLKDNSQGDSSAEKRVFIIQNQAAKDNPKQGNSFDALTK